MSDYKNQTDAALADFLKLSDHAAYEEIFKRYNCLMLAHAYKKLGSKELAKDIVQDLFTNLWYNREKVLSKNSLAPFLYVSLRNKILDFYSRQEVESKYITALGNYLIITQTATTDHTIREKQLSEYIDKQIRALPRKMRVVFELSKFEHLSNTEIAQQLNTTESNVSQHVNNAIRILRIKLRPLLPFILIIVYFF